MKPETKQILFDAWDYCDERDKSTEFMLTYMTDVSGMEYDSVVEFVLNNHEKRPEKESKS